jgi:hypothetical protein
MRYRKEDQYSPAGNELKPPLGETIVTGCGLIALGADRRRASLWPDYCFNALLIGAPEGRPVDESWMMRAVV